MNHLRHGALLAPAIAFVALVALTAAASAVTIGVPSGPAAATASWVALPSVHRSALVDRGAAPSRDEVRPPAPTMSPSPEAPVPDVTGIASNYPGTAGWMGQPTVALPGDLGGRYTGEVNGHVTVCADRCATLPVVDWCQCYWGTDDERIVDLSHAAWALVSDAPLAEGLVPVSLFLEPQPLTSS